MSSSRPSIEEIPLTPTDNESFTPSSAMRDSIITYTTDLGSSVDSMTAETTETDEIRERKPKPLGENTTKFYRKKRFWAICTAISVVLSAIFIPLFFLVLIPHIAQKAIDNSELHIVSMNISNPTDDGFYTEMSGSSDHAGSFDATLTFTGPLSVFYENNQLGTIASLDPIKIIKGQGTVKGSRQKFIISNFTVFEQFSKESMLGTSYDWTIQGTVSIQSFGITARNLNLHKVITVSGAGGFTNTTLKDLKVSLNPDQTLRLEMETNIYNPSPLGMEIGNLFLQVQYENFTLADVTSSYFVLTHGENPLTLVGNAKFPTNEADINKMATVIGAYMANRPINTTGQGLYTVLKDGVSSRWLNSTIRDFSLQTVVGNQPKSVQLINQVNFGQSNLAFTPETAYSPTMTAKNASGSFVTPFDIPFNVERLQQNLTIYFKGKPVIQFDTPTLPVTTSGTVVTFDIPSTPMKVFDDAHDLFSDFIISVSSNPETDVELIGTSTVQVKIPVGEFTMSEIPFKIPYKMPGFSLFDGKAPNISGLVPKNLTADQFVVGFTMIITNPTNGGMSVGPVNLQIVFQDQQVGMIAIENLSIVPGSSPVNVQITIYNPFQSALVRSFLAGNETVIYLRGFDGSTNIESLKKLFSGINVQTPLPSLSSLKVPTTPLSDSNSTSAEVQNNLTALLKLEGSSDP